MKKFTLFLCAIFVTLGIAATANALSVTSQLFFGETNQLSDNSAEFLINADGTTTDSGDALVQVGDRLVGAFNIGTVEALSGPDAGTSRVIGANGVNELTGIFDLTVTSANFNDVTWDFAFAPTPVATNIFTTLGVAQPAGTMVALFEDLVVDYSRLDPNLDDPGMASELALLQTASGGTDYWTFGYTGAVVNGLYTPGASEGWIANAISNDIGIIGAVPAPSNGGTANFAVSLLNDVADIGPQLGLVNSSFGGQLIGANGSGNLLGIGGADTPFDNFDNFDFVINPIPEPATFLLFGIGLLGVAGVSRRKKD